MTKLYLITCLIIAICLSPELSFGQKNIGEFNRKEQPIYANIKKEFDAIGFASSWSSDAKTAEEINQYITKAKSIVSKCEERIKSSKNALVNLSEIPSAEIKTNLEYKHWTESIIDEYNTLLKVIRSNIAAAETRKSKAKGNNNQTSSTASTSDDDFWSGNANSTPDNANGTPDNNTPSAATARNSDEATKRDQYTSERAKATKITADFERREAERVRVEGAAIHAVNTTFTNFYAMRAAGQNLKEASTLEGHFDNLEDLDRAFAQKLSEVT